MFESNNTPFTMPVMPANSGYGNNGAWGDDGAWWIIIFVLFFAFGGWGNVLFFLTFQKLNSLSDNL